MTRTNDKTKIKKQQQQTNKTINKQDVGPSFTINLDQNTRIK